MSQWPYYSLIKNNLVPLAFSDVNVDDYMSAMIAIYELQDVYSVVNLYVYSYLRTCVAYDSTVKAMGFDEVRVRDRQERRNIVREIILQELTGPSLKLFIARELTRLIPSSFQSDYIEDVMEDLNHIDENRLVGLGVTPGQMRTWKQLNDNPS